MPFTSLDFAIFFGIVLVLNWRLRGDARLYVPALCLFNIVFYGLGAPKFLPLLFAVAFLNWKAATLMTPELTGMRRKLVVWADVLLNLGILGFFKYFEFVLTTLEDMGLALHGGLFSLPEIVYPVGLSFFTFQGLSLAIDKYRDPAMETPGFMEAFAFVTFFPTVLSGPIQRCEPFLAQMRRSSVRAKDYGLAVTLILVGLFKKVALSSYLSEQVVRDVFAMPENFSFVGVLGGVYGYSAQIYLDFSGYSDLAQGVGLMLGFNVGANFQAPYLASNIRDFWRRWHISLSSWLRDYLYFSLGGSRKGSTALNLVVTQTLGGLWHGAHLRYLVWGLAHGGLLAVTHAYLKVRKIRTDAMDSIGFKSWQRPRQRMPGLKKFLAVFFTFHFVTLLWILFRADTMPRAWEIARALADPMRPGQGVPVLAFVIVALCLLGQWAGEAVKGLMTALQNRMPLTLLSLWCAFWVIIIIRLGPDGILPFIYFQY
ncbi:MAG: MBOAT family protein [Deltaproteobacteria bacterium]|jgi:D-alanyl-lipoteichoic acid acyltransferase DltB (MBOAT superfamily)|nr:MBOAT family protein [Deltaproteobacteria bacterium]